MSEEEMHVVYSKQVVEFVTVANEYCTFVENASQIPKKEFIDKLHKLSAFLYQKTVILPRIEPQNEEGIEKHVTEEQYNALRSDIELKLGTHESFLNIFEPYRSYSQEAIQVSLSECFADVYQDMKNFTEAYSNGLEEVMNDALWECQTNFEQYWGPRLLGALSVFHNLLYGESDLEEDEGKEAPKKYEKLENIDTSNWWINEFFQNSQGNQEDNE